MKHTVTNNSAALQGVHTSRGVRFLKPGETRILEDLTDYGLARVKKLPFLALGGAAKADEKPDEPSANPGPAPEEGGPRPLEQFSDDELDALFEKTFQKKPHPNAKRETKIQRIRETAEG